MKKSELRKLIREVISEQAAQDMAPVYPYSNFSGGEDASNSYSQLVTLRCPDGYSFITDFNWDNYDLALNTNTGNYTIADYSNSQQYQPGETQFVDNSPMNFQGSYVEDGGVPYTYFNSATGRLLVSLCYPNRSNIQKPLPTKTNPSPAKDVNLDLPTSPNIINPGTKDPVRGVDTGTSGPYQVD